MEHPETRGIPAPFIFNEHFNEHFPHPERRGSLRGCPRSTTPPMPPLPAHIPALGTIPTEPTFIPAHRLGPAGSPWARGEPGRPLALPGAARGPRGLPGGAEERQRRGPAVRRNPRAGARYVREGEPPWRCARGTRARDGGGRARGGMEPSGCGGRGV